ncbi:MAG: hypothetical protein JW993_20475 [Sedimentisphaerales bacterium]|nr:hypothetical protein [Sedimentisphaerales bacterium]
MSKPKSLTRRQRALIEDLFADGANEQQVLAKHKVSRELYARWLADERFLEAFENRIAQAYRAGRIILARAAHQAATTLVGLSQATDKGETTRKASLDILAAQGPAAPRPTAIPPQPTASPVRPLPPETASRILAILAEEQDAPD